MIQVVMQNAIRRLKSKLRLPAPPNAGNPAGPQKAPSDESEGKDKTVFILKFFLIATVVLLIVFGNVLT